MAVSGLMNGVVAVWSHGDVDFCSVLFRLAQLLFRYQFEEH
jgi:hypothetical protein